MASLSMIIGFPSSPGLRRTHRIAIAFTSCTEFRTCTMEPMSFWINDILNTR